MEGGGRRKNQQLAAFKQTIAGVTTEYSETKWNVARNAEQIVELKKKTDDQQKIIYEIKSDIRLIADWVQEQKAEKHGS